MCCLVSSRAFRRSPICCHCSGMRKITHIGALCSHGTKNNQHNSSTQPRTQPCTMSDKKSPSVTAAERTGLTKPPTSARRSLMCLCPLRRLKRPLQRLRPFLLLPPTRRNHPPSFKPRLLWRSRPFCLACPSIRAVLSSRL